MLRITEGQCGTCAHFGEQHPTDDRLVQIRVNGEAPEAYLDECGHPQHAGLHLKVTAISGCDGYVSATAA